MPFFAYRLLINHIDTAGDARLRTVFRGNRHPQLTPRDGLNIANAVNLRDLLYFCFLRSTQVMVCTKLGNRTVRIALRNVMHVEK